MARRRKAAAVKRSKEAATLWPHLMKAIAATIILITVVMVAGLAVIALFPVQKPAVKTAALPKKPAAPGLYPKESKPLPAAPSPVFEIYPREKKPQPPAPGSGAISPAAPPSGQRPRIAIIIDDVGYDKEIVNRLIALDTSLTLSILPNSPFNKEIASTAHQAGLEIMLHLPMEPVEYPEVDPGQGVLLTSMSPDTLLRQLAENIADVPYIKGVNNHMGSKLTAESEQLYQIFSVLKKQGLFFIDSRTTEKSLCRPSASKLQLPFAERDVFLDNTMSEADINHQLNLLLDIASRRGKAIGIAHPHPETCQVLQTCLPGIKQRAELVPASALADRPINNGQTLPASPPGTPTPLPSSDQ